MRFRWSALAVVVLALVLMPRDGLAQGTAQKAVVTVKQNYPNPFNPETRGDFGIGCTDAGVRHRVSVRIYNLLMQSVTTPVLQGGTGSVVARAGWQPASGGAHSERLDRLADALETAGPEPPSVAELTARFGADTPALLRVLERSARAVPVASDRYFSPRAVHALVTKLRGGTADGAPRTASQIKEILGLTRKYLIPFLEYCDRSGISVRTGDTRTVRRAP